MFHPHRYNITEYPMNNGYSISNFGESIRFTEFLKTRDGGEKTETAFYYNGKVGLFSELESAEEFKINATLYNKYNINVPTKIKKSWENLIIK